MVTTRDGFSFNPEFVVSIAPCTPGTFGAMGANYSNILTLANGRPVHLVETPAQLKQLISAFGPARL